MFEFLTNLLKVAGWLITIAALFLLGAFILFKMFADKWMDGKNAKLLSRITKIHDKEFEVLTEAWSRLIDVLNYVEQYVNYYQEYTNIADLSGEDLKDYLKTTPLSEADQKYILSSKDKQNTFKKIKFDYDTKLVREKFAYFHVYLQKNVIFLHKNIKHKFEEADDLIWEAINNRILSEKTRNLDAWQRAYEAIKEGIKPLQSEIEGMSQTRLRFEQAD